MAPLHRCVVEAVRRLKHPFFFSKGEEEEVDFSVSSADAPSMWNISRLSTVLGSALLHNSVVYPKHQPPSFIKKPSVTNYVGVFIKKKTLEVSKAVPPARLKTAVNHFFCMRIEDRFSDHTFEKKRFKVCHALEVCVENGNEHELNYRF